MFNILILYNPYYQKDVIEQHLKVLVKKGEVAFGKVRSKIRNIKNNFDNELNNIYKKIDASNFLQLFLTDYSNLFVAKVIKVSDECLPQLVPKYYKTKNLEVEKWFIISDMRELVRNDFETVRDIYLANFLTPNYGNHTYSVYGNVYVYPLIINLREDINYFEDDKTKHYANIFKSKEFLEIKENLIKYSFGKDFINLMHIDSLENIISAEIEYQQNKQNPLYDFTSVVTKYSKIMEKEFYIFFKRLFKFLSDKNKEILYVEYFVQGIKYTINDIFVNKPNLGTYKFLLKNKLIIETIEKNCNNSKYILSKLPKTITIIQNIRNKAVHGKSPSIERVIELRNNILGVTKKSILIELLENRDRI